MTNERLREIKITNQVLASMVVLLALALGIVVGKQKAWLKNAPEEVAVQRNLTGEPVSVEPGRAILETQLNRLISNRRSNRKFTTKPLTSDKLGGLLWSMQGITANWGERAVPTIRSAYPLRLSVWVKNVEGVQAGLYVFDPLKNTIQQIAEFDAVKADEKIDGIGALQDAPVVIAISADTTKLKAKLDGQERNDLLFYEAGHAAQNFFLEAESMSLSVSPFAQIDSSYHDVFKIPQGEILISLLAVGFPQPE